MMNNKNSGFTLVEVTVSTLLVGMLVFGLVYFSKSFFSSYDFSFQETRTTSQAQQAIISMEREIREMRDGEDGSYPLTTADDLEVVFFSDIDNDGEAERVRYYLVNTDLVKQVYEYIPGSSNYACVGGCDICHDPGDTEGTIHIPNTSWPAHKNHGDYLGACIPGGPTEEGGSLSGATERVVASYVQNISPLFFYYNSGWPSDVISNPLSVGNRLLETRLVRLAIEINIDPDKHPDNFSLSTFVHLRNLKDGL